MKKLLLISTILLLNNLANAVTGPEARKNQDAIIAKTQSILKDALSNVNSANWAVAGTKIADSKKELGKFVGFMSNKTPDEIDTIQQILAAAEEFSKAKNKMASDFLSTGVSQLEELKTVTPIR